MDLIVRNARIYTDGIEMQGDLGISGGRVSAIGNLGDDAAEIVDAAGHLVFPGLVDLGVSPLAENGCVQQTAQDFSTLTKMALAGGVTTVVSAVSFDSEKPFADQLGEFAAADTQRAWVDFGYHMFVRQWGLDARESALSAGSSGVCSVWIARTDTLSNAPGLALVQSVVRDLPESMMAVVNPTDAVLEEHFRTQLKSENMQGLSSRNSLFPEAIEGAVLKTCGAIVRNSRAHILVNGVSGERTLRELEYMRGQRYPVSAMAKLPHLIFATERMTEETQTPDSPSFPCVWPPVRRRRHQQRLWGALESGLVSAVTSAHHPVGLKQATDSATDSLSAAEGCNGIEHLLRLMFSEGIAKWRIEAETLSVVCCADPAKLAGLYPRKGSLQIGSDADFLIFDPGRQEDIRPLQGAACFDYYAGHPCAGAIKAVYLRGTRVAGEGADTSAPRGAFLERRLALA